MIEITREYLDEIPSKTLHGTAENIHLSIKGYTSQKAGKKNKKTIKNGSHNCQHKFHKDYIRMWHSNHGNCPICRRDR